MLSALIAPSAKEDNLYVRKTALREDLQKNEKCKVLIDKLIDKHILISNKDANGNATVSIVHEILISSWQIIKDWIKQEDYFINMNNHYENLSKYWIEHEKPKSDLLREKASVKEAEYFLYSWKDSASKNVTDFLRTLTNGNSFFRISRPCSLRCCRRPLSDSVFPDMPCGRCAVGVEFQSICKN